MNLKRSPSLNREKKNHLPKKKNLFKKHVPKLKIKLTYI